MIYLFHGTDVEKTRSKAFEWVAKARLKEPNLVYRRLVREELTPATLEDAAASGGLFARRTLILLDDPFPSARTGDEEEEKEPATVLTEDRITLLGESENAIVIVAPKLSTPLLKKLRDRAKMIYVFDARVARETVRGFNTALVNALAARNRAALWLELERAQRAGDAPEMLHGLLHWKARDLMEKGSRAWKAAEARRLSLDLIRIIQDSRHGGLELSLALQRFALSM